MRQEDIYSHCVNKLSVGGNKSKRAEMKRRGSENRSRIERDD